MEKEAFSLDDIEFGIKWTVKGKAKDIEGYQEEILKIGGPILIPHFHKLVHLVGEHVFLSLGLTSLFLFLKMEIKNPCNYITIMISLLLAKLYGSILDN